MPVGVRGRRRDQILPVVHETSVMRVEVGSRARGSADSRIGPPLTVRESALAGAIAFVAAGAVWGPHVFRGGFYWADDWYHARLYVFSDGRGLFANQNAHTSHFSPVLGLLLAIPYRLFGLHTPLHLALALVLSAGASTAFYVLLRTFGLERRHAGMIATLALFFPWADSSRLWTTGSMNNVAIIFFFAGLVVSLRGLRAGGRRARVLAPLGTTLYVLAVLTYEVVGGVVVLVVLVYASWCGWRRAWRRWLLDLVGVVPALAFVWLRQPTHHTTHPSLRWQLAHAGRIAQGAAALLWKALIPGGAPGAAVAGAVLVVALGALVARYVLDVDDPARALLSRWLAIAAASVLAIGLAYSPYVPGLGKYVPSAPGVGNRVNLLAAFGYAGLVYALVMLTGLLTARVARRKGAAVIGSLLCAAIVIAYTAIDRQHEREWDQATRIANHELDTVARLVRDPRPGTVIYVFGDPNYVAPGVPVFAIAGDLNNAVKVRLRSRRADAYPMRPMTRWSCELPEMYPRDAAFGARQGARYGRGIFVSVPLRSAVTVDSPAACRLWSRRFSDDRVSQSPLP
jgi:hypothetical protein